MIIIMSITEYKYCVQTRFWDQPCWRIIIRNNDFERLINIVAQELFYLKDLNSTLAIETHRRLTQFRKTGKQIHNLNQ